MQKTHYWIDFRSTFIAYQQNTPSLTSTNCRLCQARWDEMSGEERKEEKEKKKTKMKFTIRSTPFSVSLILLLLLRLSVGRKSTLFIIMTHSMSHVLLLFSIFTANDNTSNLVNIFLFLYHFFPNIFFEHYSCVMFVVVVCVVFTIRRAMHMEWRISRYNTTAFHSIFHIFVPWMHLHKRTMVHK